MDNHDSIVVFMEPRTGKQLHHGWVYSYPPGHGHSCCTAAYNPGSEVFVAWIEGL